MRWPIRHYAHSLTAAPLPQRGSPFDETPRRASRASMGAQPSDPRPADRRPNGTHHARWGAVNLAEALEFARAAGVTTSDVDGFLLLASAAAAAPSLAP